MSGEPPLVETAAVTCSLVFAHFTNSGMSLCGEEPGTTMTIEWTDIRHTGTRSTKTS